MKKIITCLSLGMLTAIGWSQNRQEQLNDAPALEQSASQVTFSRCRKDATVFVDGVKVSSKGTQAIPDSLEIITGGIPGEYGDLISDHAIVQTTVYPNSMDETIVSGTKTGPVTGYEGHNFVKDPAIIYPNPVQSVMQVKSTDPITVIEILNLHGQVIKSFAADEVLAVNDLPAGNYYVRIHFGNMPDVQVEKIIIMK